jgi:aerobic carbon-monoxide dehydrogenase small subunit
MKPTTFKVNGQNVSTNCEPRLLLCDYLRDTLRLPGTKVGCEHGACGACTVLFDGEPIRSCLMFTVQAEGHAITTIEGLVDGTTLSPLQQAFHECHGLQCGFCTAGFIVTLTALFRNCPSPTDEQISATLGAHICRCTGYVGILAAVRRVARENRVES